MHIDENGIFQTYVVSFMTFWYALI